MPSLHVLIRKQILKSVAYFVDITYGEVEELVPYTFLVLFFFMCKGRTFKN